MQFNNHVHKFFVLFEELIDDGFVLQFARNDEVLTIIKDKGHLKNFKKSLNLTLD
ncbi:hypothetical protein MYP_844 [Sporocytophaga myxococcoides]|uniref:Uncharacterized protein n=2 Tax=Sporocytophaga myxococcoides TaxID=153721 RepID=A0A098LAZ0_9BACT|nr:hypothetical protein MYP_844 [Sporocytophaga myxococcoides]